MKRVFPSEKWSKQKKRRQQTSYNTLEKIRLNNSKRKKALPPPPATLLPAPPPPAPHATHIQIPQHRNKTKKQKEKTEKERKRKNKRKWIFCKIKDELVVSRKRDSLTQSQARALLSSLESQVPRAQRGQRERERERRERGLDLGCGRRVRSSKTACAMEKCGILRSVIRCTITSTHAVAEWRQKLTECCHRIPAGDFMAADFQQYPPIHYVVKHSGRDVSGVAGGAAGVSTNRIRFVSVKPNVNFYLVI